MSSICPKCGATTDKGPVINQVCLCGGVPEEIDSNILKALLPFAPDKTPVGKEKMFAMGAILFGLAFAVSRKR